MERANQAQLAARKIKDVKTRRRTPVQAVGPVQQSMSFGAGPGAGAGLFGGGIQAPNTFSFAPTGGPSFPPSNFVNPFANRTPDASDNEDPRADTTGEEAKRRNQQFQRDPDSTLQSSNPFGQSQATPAASLFSLGTSQTASSGSFNQTTSQNSSANPFAFNANQPTTSTPGIKFGSGPAQDKPTSNIFGGFGQQTAQSTAQPVFNFTNPQDKPAVTPQFPFGTSTTQPATPAINFGSTPAVESPANNLFGSSQPAAQPTTSGINFNFTPAVNNTNSLFGASHPAPASNAIASSGTPAPTSNIFGNLKSATPSTNNMFQSQTQTAPPANNLFGASTQQPQTSNIFGSLSQTPAKPPTTQPQSTSSIFASLSQTPAKQPTISEPKPSQSTPASNLFAGFGKPTDNTAKPFSTLGQQAPTLFGGVEKEKAPQSDLFGTLNKPIEQPVAQPKVNGGLTNGTGADRPNKNGNSAPSEYNPPASTLFGSSNPLFSAPPNAQAAISDSGINSNSLFSRVSKAPSTEANSMPSFSPMKPIDAPTSASQPPPSGMFPSLSQPTQSPSKPIEAPKAVFNGFSQGSRSTASFGPSTNGLRNGHLAQKPTGDPHFQSMATAASLTDEELSSKAPSSFNGSQRAEFYTAYRLRSLNSALAGILETIPSSLDVSTAFTFYNEKRAEILGRSSIKRKADEDQENENQSKRNKQFAPLGPTLSQPEPSPAPKSPQKALGQLAQPWPLTNGSTTPKAPSFAAPQLFSQSPAPEASPAPKGKRKAGEDMDKDSFEAKERASKRFQMDGDSTSAKNLAADLNPSPAGSNTSNIFKSILESPSKTKPEKKLKPLPAASQDDAPRFNPFANLPIPPSPSPSNIFAPKATPATSSPFTFKPATTNINAAASPPNSTTSAVPNPFQIKATTTNSNGSASPSKSTIKPPNFGSGGPVNFLAQFSQKASKDASTDEAALMQKAKDDEYDSDEEETEAEWEAKYKKRREEEKKAVEELAKSKRASFVPGQGFTFGPMSNTETAKPALSDAGTSVFSSLNGSRTPTPNPFGKPINNIFGHLSSVPASEKDEDTDSDDEAVDADSENKDPSYQPGNETSSPGTPAEETGPGIASAKKTPFGAHNPGLSTTTSSVFGTGLFNTSKSGTTSASGAATPSRSLFDRISKDSTGNPIRSLDGSSDEKENTQPSTTTNVFNDTQNAFASSFSKISETPADQTWKKDSPIKFGSATPGADVSNPVVSVTAATPTKASANPFATLFGNTNSSTAKSVLPGSSVGFSFGGSSASSLFPSAAVSASTSRATSPGATTDGASDSAAEGDPDAEKHEQINLTSGGPGEENEEVLYECRAKALLYAVSKSSWDSKGLGFLRVLKDKETNATRILLRADPSGAIILNKALLPQKYEANGKTVKLMTAGSEEKSLETWLLQIKTAEIAEGLAKVLQSNKPSS